MSFRIFVVVLQAAIPMPADQHEWDKWARESSKLTLFEETLGSDGTVYTFWSRPAVRLGLPLLGAIYQHGLHLETETEFEALETELDELEFYWHAHLLDELAADGNDPARLLEALEERLRRFRRATHLARDMNAVLFVEQPL